MDFQTFKSNLEKEISKNFKFELLEFCYSPYSFGHGRLALRIKGICFLLIFDGKENILELYKSKKHEKYSNCTWQKIKSYDGLDFFDISIINKLTTKDIVK